MRRIGFLGGAAAHLAMNAAMMLATSKPVEAKDTVPLPAKMRRRRAKVTAHQAHKPSGSHPVPGGGKRERERALAKMEAAAPKRQAERDAARTGGQGS
jgi:hypothetical protein